MKILIIEDEAILVMDIEAVVHDAGHIVLGDAASVRQLADMCPDGSPDLALIDINLAEGSSGLDASLDVRKRWPNAFIVFVTANPAKIPLGHAGSHGVIAKPFSEAGLVSALEYVSQGICTPPPIAVLPGSFSPFPAFEVLWSLE